MRRRAIVAALAIVAVAGLGLLLPGALSGSPVLVGAQVHPLWVDSTVADFDRELDLLRDAGANAARMDLGWSTLEAEGKGRYADWYVEKADTFIDHARERGLRVIVTLHSTPCWASTAPERLRQGCSGEWWERGVTRYPPARSSDFADAAAFVARRWGSRIAALEIWNEPNHRFFFRAPDPAAAYAEILRAAYPRIKDESSDLTVVGGSLAWSDGDFLRRLYDRGIRGHYDALAIHPYEDPSAREGDPRKHSYRAGVPWVREVMKANGDGRTPLWLTELGWPTCVGGNDWCVSEGEQAARIADALRVAKGWPFVEAAIVYSLRNRGTSRESFEDQMGLLRRDFSPKPSFTAFRGALEEF